MLPSFRSVHRLELLPSKKSDPTCPASLFSRERCWNIPSFCFLPCIDCLCAREAAVEHRDICKILVQKLLRARIGPIGEDRVAVSQGRKAPPFKKLFQGAEF